VLGEILPFESVAFEKGIEIKYDLIEEDIKVKGNASQLGQLTSILVDNAIEHSSGGDVEVRLTRNRGKAELKVINSGEEIPADKQKMLFERFYRVDDSRGAENNHYGLGLAIAKSIVDIHGGEISVKCEDGNVIFKVEIKTLR